MAGNCITSILHRDVAFASGCCFFGFCFRFFYGFIRVCFRDGLGFL